MSVDYRPDYDPADVDSDYGHTGGDIPVPQFTANMKPFRFWCQKALPLVYDDSLSYYEVLCKVVKQLNDFLTDLQTATGAIDEFAQQFVVNQQFINNMADQLGQNVEDLEDYINDRLEDYMTAYTQLQSYVNNYFDNLDVQQEINNKLDDMAEDGTFNTLFDPVITAWMTAKTAQIDEAIANQNAVQAQQNGRISVLEGRMDTFSSLPAGSTSGNAELLDIRTNFLGETYQTAGDAVRASDMIASGFQSISATKLEEWDGNSASSTYDTIQIDIGGYKGGHVVVIGSFKFFQQDIQELGRCAVYATNTQGKVEDSNAVNYLPGAATSIFKNFTQLTTSISGEERLLLQFAIPDDYAYQYLKIGHFEHSPLSGSYTEPLYIVYANSWSKTPVDDTLTISGDAADAKATGDALSEVNERIGDVMSLEGIVANLVWEQGSISSTGEETSTNIRIRTGFIDIADIESLYVNVASGYFYDLNYYSAPNASGFIEATGAWQTTSRKFTMQSTYKYVRLIMCQSGNPPILPTAGSNLTMEGGYALKDKIADIDSWIENNAVQFGGYVNADNYTTVLSDANNAKDGNYYILRFVSTDSNITAHLPFAATQNGVSDVLTLITYASTNYKMQFLYARNGILWTRTNGGGTWGPWYSKDDGVTIAVGAGRQFPKLTDAMKFAFEHANTTVVVYPGTYNIISEMGSDYWDNFTDYSDLTHAIIGNGAHFIFSPDSRVVCQYEGDNNNVKTLYSPFNTLDGSEGDFTIEGMTLVVSGCRYAIHDDVGASTVQQTHRYINCDITNDIRCIGAGLGANMTVEMRDCIFRSSRETPGNSPVSWHNSGGGTTGKGSIVMTGCYVTGVGDNAVQFLAYGESTKMTRVLVSNNRFNAEPVCRKYDETIPYMNFEMLAFNNTIEPVS